MQRLIEQTIHINIIDVKDISCFRIQIFGCEIIFMCSYIDLNISKQKPFISKEFKENYQGKVVPAKINNITNYNM